MKDDANCQKCASRWAFGRAVYLAGSAYVARLCIECEQDFRDQPWLETDSQRFALLEYRANRAAASLDLDEDKLCALIAAAVAMKAELKAKCKAWLAQKPEAKP